MIRLPLFRLLAVLCLLASSLAAQAPRKREFRAVWIATVANTDWPKQESRGNSDAQKAELSALLDRLQSTGFNAVFFQVRPECDAFYRSAFEPWSYWLTGAQGRPPEPAYDPLEFAIGEAHRRGMELHAWFNPFRAVRSIGNYSLAPGHVSVRHPEWILTFTRLGMKMLDPGRGEVREYVARVVADVVRRYDVDGVHFDDYFYPYPDRTIAPPFNGIGSEDRRTFADESRGFKDLPQWRRDNVNRFVRNVHDSIRAIKPFVRFGIGPFGIWKNGTPAATSGLGAYEGIYCDAMAWLREGTVDYLAPQVYWQIGGDQDYASLLTWWSDSARAYGRHLYPGMAAYKILQAGWTASELPRQMRLNRSRPEVQGEIFFRATAGVNDNPRGFADSLRSGYYRYRAIPPAMGWKDAVPPLSPRAMHLAHISGDGYEIQWEPPLPAPDGDTARAYAVYRFGHPPLTEEFADPRNLFGVVADTHLVVPLNGGNGRPQYYAARSLDRNENESETGPLLEIAEPYPPVLASPADGAREGGDSVSFSWYPAMLAAAYRVQVASDGRFEGELLIDRSAGADTALRMPLPTPIRPWIPLQAPARSQLLLEKDSSIMVVSSVRAGRTTDRPRPEDSSARLYWRARGENRVGAGVWSLPSALLRPQLVQTADPANPPESFAFSCRAGGEPGSSVLVAFALPRREWVQIRITNSLRTEERVLLDRPVPAGSYSIDREVRPLSGGYYICRIIAGENVLARTIVLGAGRNRE